MNRKQNEEIARSLMYFDKTVALLRCGASDEDVERLAELLRRGGRYVYEITEKAFISSGGDRVASAVVICDAITLSRDVEAALERYIKENGKVFIFGGPIFGNTDITKGGMVLEGVSPLYKIFREENCNNFETLPQCITNKTLLGNAPYVICPNARPNGEGYDKGRLCRILPIVSVEKSGGRADGHRGHAAFFVLFDSIAHMPRTAGTRLGNVSPVTQGSQVGVIGMPLSSFFEMNGDGLFEDMMAALDRGLFLYEGGADRYVVKPGESLRVGAKIMSGSRDYIEVGVRFALNGISKEKYVLTVGQNYTDVTEHFEGLCEGEYKITTELLLEGKVIDRIESELFVTNGLHSKNKEDFVSVEKGDFMLRGKKWHMFGINYFPLYQVSLEIHDYWRGAFSKVIYTPAEVEKDLRHIKAMGMNTVAIRIDSNSFDEVMDPLRDFFCRCRRLGLKVMMSFCNITNPLWFNEKAFSYFMKELDVSDDPTLFCHDFFWESGGSFVNTFHARRFADEWRAWLLERYGSYENAERSFGIPLNRTSAGDVICPPMDYYYSGERDSKYRYLLSAFTRFCTEMVGRKWSRAVRIMKKYDNNHLYTNRTGHIDDASPNVFVSAAAKHLDFMALESYGFTQDEIGMYASAAFDRAAHCASRGKPVTWVEYGLSLSGMGGLAVGTRQIWDGVKNKPLASRLEEHRAYQAQFATMFKLCDVKGSMPWFYAGGFRFTEHSDYGYIAPNGETRPAMDEYLKLRDWFEGNRAISRSVEQITVDPEGSASHWCDYVFGKGVFSKFAFDRARFNGGDPMRDTRVPGIGIEAAKRALKNASGFEFVLDGSGTTSADTPLTLCGGAEYKGYGAIKNLDGEFYTVTLSRGNEKVVVENGDSVTLPAGTYDVVAELGNIAVAKWLSGEKYGCVVVKCGENSLKLAKNAEYLEDAEAFGKIDIKEDGELTMRLSAVSRADFGEVFKIKIKVTK